MSEGFVDVQNNEDKVASPRDCNDLPATTLKLMDVKLIAYLAIFGTLDDPRQVKNLNFCTAVLKHSWDSGQGCN